MENKDKAKIIKKEHPLAKCCGVAFTAICAFAIGWLVKGMMPASSGGMPQGMTDASAAEPLVKVKPATLGALNPPNEFIGRVEPIQDVDLGARISGYVTKVNFAEGALVEEGELLFEIDPEPYEAVVALRQAELIQAEAEVERADRYLKRLTASDKRGITQADMDKAESDVAAGRARVAQASANKCLADIDLKHCRIHAPIAGKVGRTVANVGDYVAPSVGTLVRIVQIDPIRVVFSVTDRHYIGFREKISAANLSDALRMRLVLPTGTIPDLLGTADFEDNEMSSQTATLPIRIRFDNRDNLLVPRSYVKVLVDLKDPPQYPIVPQSSLVTNSRGDFVYVLGDDNKVEMRSVKTGDVADGSVEIIEGIKVGDNIVFEGVLKISDGGSVRVVDEKEVNSDQNPESSSQNGGAEKI